MLGLAKRDREAIAILRQAISAVAPSAYEIVYPGALGYGSTDSGFDRILYITPFAKRTNLGFFYTSELPDPLGRDAQVFDVPLGTF